MAWLIMHMKRVESGCDGIQMSPEMCWTGRLTEADKLPDIARPQRSKLTQPNWKTVNKAKWVMQ